MYRFVRLVVVFLFLGLSMVGYRGQMLAAGLVPALGK